MILVRRVRLVLLEIIALILSPSDSSSLVDVSGKFENTCVTEPESEVNEVEEPAEKICE